MLHDLIRTPPAEEVVFRHLIDKHAADSPN